MVPCHIVHDDLDLFAKNDGFSSGEEMVAWFADQGDLPYIGYLHQWEIGGMRGKP